MVHLFEVLIVAHVMVGVIGLVSFWIPVIGRKGGPQHKRWGHIFARSMLVTGALAFAISTVTLIDPIGTHPHIPDPVMVRGIFGWMMQYLAVLTINLAWYGISCVRHQRNHAGNREWRNLGLQFLLLAEAAHVAWLGWRIDQPLMMGISTIGFATGATNLWFLYMPQRRRKAWLHEHLKGLVGAGISVYTAFFAFGAVRLAPALALNPAFWSIPLVIGLAIILYHWRRLSLESAGASRNFTT